MLKMASQLSILLLGYVQDFDSFLLKILDPDQDPEPILLFMVS